MGFRPCCEDAHAAHARPVFEWALPGRVWTVHAIHGHLHGLEAAYIFPRLETESGRVRANIAPLLNSGPRANLAELALSKLTHDSTSYVRHRQTRPASHASPPRAATQYSEYKGHHALGLGRSRPNEVRISIAGNAISR